MDLRIRVSVSGVSHYLFSVLVPWRSRLRCHLNLKNLFAFAAGHLHWNRVRQKRVTATPVLVQPALCVFQVYPPASKTEQSNNVITSVTGLQPWPLPLSLPRVDYDTDCFYHRLMASNYPGPSGRKAVPCAVVPCSVGGRGMEVSECGEWTKVFPLGKARAVTLLVPETTSCRPLLDRFEELLNLMGYSVSGFD